ncbi:LacI family DNA-binding transcriptional regulator [Altericroceibacterium endophyticum]|uniref:LacI family DNA-binding transcriptional regulator n=1 Tax=Altericroceibacterium endophyticum TaxID=1808508 RepID=A0A6I4T683_9SPHN|nr:LacI family DNA-binding transcriptional regulator [Altericroceibacterium endophyticum]MXO66416.1 LacI family DNA-binding transcriptional regulator [Altericroceibacterium endophyticum]
MSEKIRTIYDLAKLAGVSGATVSRALAGSSVVSAKTAERIRELAKEHGFRPSSLARNLRIQRKGAIGVVIPLGHDQGQHISDPFFMTLIGALADELTEKGFDLMLSRVIPDHDDWLENMIDSARVDGFIIIGQSNQSEILDKAARHYLPMVAWGAFVPGQTHCAIGSDNYLGGSLAASHLIERGCKRLAFLGNPQAIEIALRLDGARAAVARAGEDITLLESPTHLAAEASGVDIDAFLDATSIMPDGILAASDLIAVTAIQVLASRGMSVPDDVRVMGYDDLLLAQTSVPTLSTIRQDIRQGARHLVESLLARINGQTTGSIVLNPELIVRGSST